MFPHLVNAVYILVLVILSLSFCLCLSLHPLQSARGGVSPRAKHMLLSIALIQMQRGGIIARVAVASQGLCPSLAPVSQAHAISIKSLCLPLSLCIKPQTFYQTRPSRFISTQTHPLKIILYFFIILNVVVAVRSPHLEHYLH